MSESKHLYDDYFHMLKPVLISKVEEFLVLGYEDVNKEDIWRYLTVKKWKKPKEGIRVYELVSDIMSIRVGDYMNFATVEAFRSSDPFEDFNNEDIGQLLKTEDT